ncbi:hypothetical protein [Caloranaerobacter sp. DY30410]|uniref:hypothetical protein n=1 Tax=Caloranaerobacter sp. DY30410 TaxID=3238305 RepID=UPI003CFE4AC3
MQVIEMNKGAKISYIVDEVNKTITFQKDEEEIIINLENEQEDVEKVIDISLDKQRSLKVGVDKWYVANIVIPPAKYILVDTGEVNEQGDAILQETKAPLDMNEVKLILWNIQENNENGGI